MDKPIIYLAFANQKDNLLAALNQEMQGLKDVFRLFVVNESVVWMIDEEVTVDLLNKSLSNIKTSDRPKIIHYSGHAGVDLWELADDNNFRDNKLNNLFFGMANTALVFMNACCTEPLKNYLLQKVGVQAVIATTSEISDSQAKDFSIAFYQNLSLPKATLEIAFRAACATKAGFETAEGVGATRGLMRKSDFDKKDVLPWGIYFKDEAARNWVFNDNLKDTVPQDIANLYNEYTDARNQIVEKETALTPQLALLDAAVADAKSKNDFDTAVEKMAEKKMLLADLQKLYADTDKMRQDIENFDRSTRLKDQIDQFNFTAEFNDLLTKYPALPNGAYILRGTEECGLSFFAKRMSVLLRQFSDTYRPWRIDLNPKSESSESMLLRLKKGLRLTDAPANTMTDLAKIFYTAQFVLPNTDPFVLILDNRENILVDELKIVLNEFWVTLNGEIKKNKNLRRVLILILVRTEMTGDFDHQIDFNAALPQNLTDDCVVCLTNEVAPLEAKYLKEFCLTKADVFNEWALRSDEFFVPDAPRVVPILLRMSEKMNAQKLGQYIHDQEDLKFCKI